MRPTPALRALALLAVVLLPGPASAGPQGPDEKSSRISDAAVAHIEPDDFPARPRPLLELGSRFLGTGTLRSGITLPGGAVWQPQLVVFGTLRSGLHRFETDGRTAAEWANRLDLLVNLQLSYTERLLVGFRPLDRDGRFSGYRFEPDDADGWQDAGNAELTTLFFEGDFGELFPNLDRDDSRSLDLGFAVGRQPLFYQEGLLVDDSIDAVGITRNTLFPRGGTDLQLTVLAGWNQVDRNGAPAPSADLFGFTAAADFPERTLHADLFLVRGDRDTNGAYWGVSSVQRIGHMNASFRALGSHALDEESAVVSDGYLLLAELSWTPAWSHDLVYFNPFVAIDRFSPAARGPGSAGPLGRVGILFEPGGLGSYEAPLGGELGDMLGAGLGYQWLLAHGRRQVVVEVGGRKRYRGAAAAAAGVRVQQALGRRLVARLDGFAVRDERDEASFGGRLELRVEF